MFEARIYVQENEGNNEIGRLLDKDELLEVLKLSFPLAVNCEVLVESGGEGQPKGSSKMTLRCWNKKNGYHARYIPMTSTPNTNKEE